jgi:hypothetical protein
MSAIVYTVVCIRRLYRTPLLMALLSPAVTICNASLTFTNSPFCPHTVFTCFAWISEQTAIISLHNINWLVCITRRGVFTARYEPDLSIKIRLTEVFNCSGCSLPASHRGAPVSIQGHSMWDLCWTNCYLDGFAPGTSNFLRLYHSINVPFTSALERCRYDEQTGEVWEHSRKPCSSEIGERWIEKNFQFLLVCNGLSSSKRSVHTASSGTSLAVH